MKQSAAALVCALLFVPLIGGTKGNECGNGPTVLFRPQKNPILAAERLHGNSLFASRRYSEAANVYQDGYRKSMRCGDTRSALRFLNNLAGCQFTTFHHWEAMATYLKARELAGKIGDFEVQGTVSLNISSLYLQMGDISAAADAAERGLAVVEKHHGPDYPMPQLLTQLGRIRAFQNRMPEAERLFIAAIEESDRRGNVADAAKAWDHLGTERLSHGDPAGAERALVEAFRLRLLYRLKDIQLSYPKLATLRLAQGDLYAADVLIGRAIQLGAVSGGGTPDWSVLGERGDIDQALGRSRQAFEDYREALVAARRWKLRALPVDALRTSTDVKLNGIYSSFVSAGSRLYFESRAPYLLRETFEAQEEGRAASLREAAAGHNQWLRHLPEEYGKTLARLRNVETASMRDPSSALRQRDASMRLRLLEMETRAGLRSGNGRFALEEACSLAEIQRTLSPSEALLSFELGRSFSLLWAITNHTAELYQLPPAGVLVPKITAFRSALLENRETAEAAGRGLYRTLFGRVSRTVQSRNVWKLELDEALFELPVAALVTSDAGEPTNYLIESRAIEVVATAAMPTADGPPNRARGNFLGIGDPIYNSADPRLATASPTSKGLPTLFPSLFAAPAPNHQLQFTRLVGSGMEVRRAAAAWTFGGSQTVLLTGGNATKERLRQVLAEPYSVVHFATHVVRSAHWDDEALIALGADGRNEPELLGASEIRMLDAGGAVVVLSGCSSGAAPALPGAGLMGLTRAWLLAGADSVIASQWPTPDDTGELFARFYLQLRAETDRGQRDRTAVALQQAQIEMLKSATWRSRPSYWAAYFMIGSN